MNGCKLFLLLFIIAGLQACASGPGKPGVASTDQPSASPNMNYIYRGPPPGAVR